MRYRTGRPLTRQSTMYERAAMLRWHHAHGANVTATCRQFGISRPTLYRWLKRYNPDAPYASLKARSQAPDTVRAPTWSDHDLLRVAELNMRHPAWGRRRLHRELAKDGVQWSEATVGRLLSIVRAGCPMCGGKDGRHAEAKHALVRDLWQLGSTYQHLYGRRTKLQVVRRQQHRKRQSRARKRAD